ncbi:MAG: SPOR domain-containing protein [Bacteroidota bacterium]
MILIAGCSGAKETQSPQSAGPEVDLDKIIIDSGEEKDESSSLPDPYGEDRSKLSDTYSSQSNAVPEAFQYIQVPKEEVRDPYQGYRIQIFSGEDVQYADTIAAKFRAWADSTLIEFQPETYTFFKTPYYRVHVGDFQERNRAIMFSNIVKRNFRGAWVVNDRINPWQVPADSIRFITK